MDSYKNPNIKEDSIGSYLTPDLYKKAYRYIVEKFRENDVDADFVWSPNVTSYPNDLWNQIELYYPGDNYVDWINMTGINIDNSQPYPFYFYGWYANTIAPTGGTFDGVYHDFYQTLRRSHPDKPMMAEVASQNFNGTKVNFINELFDNTELYPNIRMYNWVQVGDGNDVSLSYWNDPDEVKQTFTRQLTQNQYFNPYPIDYK